MANKGLSPRTFQGLNKKRMAKGSGSVDRVVLKQGDSVVVQFLGPISDFMEYEMHTFKDGSKWQYVPCAGDDCPLCADDDSDVAKTSYRFCCNVYSHKDKKVLILEGPKDLAGRIALRFERGETKFLRSTWEVSKFPTTPVSYDVERAETRPVRLDGQEEKDLMGYIVGQMERYFGSDMPTGGGSKEKAGPSSLDDDWEDDSEWEEDDEEFTEEELLKLGRSELADAANEVGVKVTADKITKANRKKLIAAILKRQ